MDFTRQFIQQGKLWGGERERTALWEKRTVRIVRDGFGDQAKSGSNAWIVLST